MVGGLFSGLLAPYAFSWIAEYPILRRLPFCAVPSDKRAGNHSSACCGRLPPPVGRRSKRASGPSLWSLGSPCCFHAISAFDLDEDPQLLKVIILALAAASLVLLRDPPKSAFAVALALAMIWLYPPSETHPESVRSFLVSTKFTKARTDVSDLEARINHPWRPAARKR